MSTSSTSSSPISPTGPNGAAHAQAFIPFTDLILQHELGRGHFGRVLLADYLGTQVAAKQVFHSTPTDAAPPTASPATVSSTGSDFAKYFAREVDTLMAARHPNCVQFMGIAHDPATHQDYILTEYLPGGNLADHWIHNLVEHPHLAWRLRVGFAIDVARALAYLHAHDIMHRDLKGQNLLVTENKRVKVCDFGLARVRAKTVEERKRMSYCGTDAYMAPEIMLCTDFDASVDTFSYGVFLLELVTRRRADLFPRPPQLGLTVDVAAVSAYRPVDCPPALWDLATACVDVDPKSRPTWKHVLGVLGACEAALVSADLAEAAVAAAGHAAAPVHVGAEVVKDPRAAGASSLDRAPSESALGGSSADLTGGGGGAPAHGSLDGGLDAAADAAASPLSPAVPASPAAAAPALGVVVPHRFSLLHPPSMDKCRLCKKRFGMHRRLVCDDCGYACHRKCVTLVPPSCELKGGIKHYHERYLEDLQRRSTTASGASKPGATAPV